MLIKPDVVCSCPKLTSSSLKIPLIRLIVWTTQSKLNSDVLQFPEEF